MLKIVRPLPRQGERRIPSISFDDTTDVGLTFFRLLLIPVRQRNAALRVKIVKTDYRVAVLKRMSTAARLFASFFLFLFVPSEPTAEERRCQPESVRVRSPDRVLIIPLLRKDPGSAENERWAEGPAAQTEAFYRARFSANVTRLRDIRLWADYYRETAMMRKFAPFDRVIFIGHGGYDGPILNGRIVQSALTVEGEHAQATRIVEAQPGLEETVTISYSIGQNRDFSRFMESHWKQLSRKEPADIRKILLNGERRLQPLDLACMERQCPAEAFASLPDDSDREIKRAACESVCRNPLFVWRSSDEIAPERFRTFVRSLGSLTARDGLIVLGMCNPGSDVPERESPWDVGGALVHSNLASGPHQTYVHLLAAASARTVAGPIGKTSAEDVVSRITGFEERRPQRNLRIVAPATRCSP